MILAITLLSELLMQSLCKNDNGFYLSLQKSFKEVFLARSLLIKMFCIKELNNVYKHNHISENCKKRLKHEYVMSLRAINQAKDNVSVIMLNYFRELCMFDQCFESTMKTHFPLQMLPAERGLAVKNKRERATRESWLASTGSPGVFSRTQPRWPYCVSKHIEWLALWQVCLCGVQIYRVSTTVLLHSQVTTCSSQQGVLVVFTLLLDGNCH